jgi:hypothetical protein
MTETYIGQEKFGGTLDIVKQSMDMGPEATASPISPQL